MMKIQEAVTQLDKIASYLEKAGNTSLATELDTVSNALEVSAGLRDWFHSAKDQIKKMLGPKVMSPEQALEVLKHNGIHQVNDKMLSDLLGSPADLSKTAGILPDFLKSVVKNPVQVALLSLALAAGSVNAADINKMIHYMPMPSDTQVSLLESGVAPLWLFKSQFKSMVESNLDNKTPLGRYIQDHLSKGESKDQLISQLREAFLLKLKDPKHKSTFEKLQEYLNKKNVQDTSNFLEPLLQEVAQDKL
jgi:hypothetical protein